MLLKETLIGFLYLLIQCVAYTPYIALLNKNYTQNKKYLLFTLLSVLVTTSIYFIFPNLNVINIIFMLIIFINSKLVFKIDTALAFVFTTLCSALFFITNIFCLSFNILHFDTYYIIYNSFILLVLQVLSMEIYIIMTQNILLIYLNALKVHISC